MSSGSSGDDSSDSRKLKYKKDKKHEKKDKKDKDKGKDKDKDKDKKDKDKSKSKDKDKKHKAEEGHNKVTGSFQQFQQSLAPVQQHTPEHQNYGQFTSPPIVPHGFDPHPPPVYQNTPPAVASTRNAAAATPSGYRVPLTTTAAFPGSDQAGQPACYDADGSPIFIGSALFEKSVQPCKIGPHLSPFASVAYGGYEHGHHGRYDLLPFDPATMEFVPTSYGKIPSGRRPIEGGYEEYGPKLYHAVASINGVRVPGKTGEHL
jgi:hypothetical protein